MCDGAIKLSRRFRHWSLLAARPGQSAECSTTTTTTTTTKRIGALAMDCHNTVQFPAVAARLSCPPLRRPGACRVVPRG
jgi:hypothetical protein